MKLLFTICLLFSGSVIAQTGFYQIKLKTIDNQSASFDSYRGKKILVATSDIADLQIGGMAFLDSLQSANPKIIVVVIPTLDAADSLGTPGLAGANNFRSKSAIVTVPALVNNSAKMSQNNFFQWLSGNKEKMHFDPVFAKGIRYMMISESGILYAMLEKDVSGTTLNEVIQQADIKN